MTTTGMINAALRERFCAPEWATAFEVQEQTGISRRRADCLAMNCYNSRGLEINGVEVKVSRSDWQRELKNPKKTEEGVWRYCDRWWIAAPKGMVKPDELPLGWGLLEYDKEKIKQVVKAEKLSPLPPDRSFMASFLRGVNSPSESQISELVAGETARLRQTSEAQFQAEQNRHKEELQRYASNHRRLQELFGLRLDWLNETKAEQVAEFVRLALQIGPTGCTQFLEKARSRLSEVTAAVDLALAKAEEIPTLQQEAHP